MSMSVETKCQFEREEHVYWQRREELLERYRGKWVAIVGGQVVAVGEQMNKTAAEAFHKTRSTVMYVNLVGNEDIVLRVRQVKLGYYDPAYVPPMPMIEASVSDLRITTPTEADFVVDTGADLTLLRQSVADQIDLWNDVAGRLQVGGIGGVPEMRELYSAFVNIAG